MEEFNWQPPIKKWYTIDTETYKVIFEQAKERFEDIISESESITNKSIKMLSALAVLFGFIVGSLIEKKSSLEYYWVFLLFYVIDIILLFILIAPKEIKNRGLSPKVLIPSDLDNTEDQGYETRLIYFRSIGIIQNNTDFMIQKNACRSTLYKWAFLLLIINIVSCGVRIIQLL